MDGSGALNGDYRHMEAKNAAYRASAVSIVFKSVENYYTILRIPKAERLIRQM